MTMTLRTAVTGLVAGVLTMAAATPAVASTYGTQPPGPPDFSGDPLFTGEYTGQGALVRHCRDNDVGAGAGVIVFNQNHFIFNNDTPRGGC